MEQLDLDDIQRLIVCGYGDLREAAYVLLRITNAEGAKRWLLQLLPRVGKAKFHHNAQHTRIALAFTYPGLTKLGLDASAHDTLVPEFRQGMNAPARARVLGDLEAHDSVHWRWGGTSNEVHILCAIFGDANIRRVEEALRHQAQASMEWVDTVYAQLRDDEPFGFRDNLSQPLIAGTRRAHALPHQAVAAGEFLLGYRNEMGQYPASPQLPVELDPDGLLARDRSGKCKDFGRNGSYMVVRELEQNVEAFYKLDPETAFRMMGRERDGTPLAVRKRQDPILDFSYYHEDPAGVRCPLGAHIRRANPRDAFADPQRGVTPGDARRLANQHRILRRSRVLNDKPGLFFVCFNANLERQFEFVQQAWLMNPKFDGLHDEADPLLSRRSAGQTKFTSDWKLQRAEAHALTDYVTPRGGAYFFMPGHRALRYLTRTAADAS